MLNNPPTRSAKDRVFFVLLRGDWGEGTRKRAVADGKGSNTQSQCFCCNIFQSNIGQSPKFPIISFNLLSYWYLSCSCSISVWKRVLIWQSRFPFQDLASRTSVISIPKTRFPCQFRISWHDFSESRFPTSGPEIPHPVKKFCVFPNPSLYFGEISDPERPCSIRLTIVKIFACILILS